MLNSICNAGCRGSCRCGSEHELCLVVGEINKVKIPCPADSKGCILDAHDSDQTSFLCPCCSDVIQTFNNVLTIDLCGGCYVTIDLTTHTAIDKMRHSPCKMNYWVKLTATTGGNSIVNKIFLKGNVCLDWSGV